MNKIQKQLNFTCSQCSATFQLLEIHQGKQACEANCLSQWEAILSQHYQEHIILHLAKEEARQEEAD